MTYHFGKRSLAHLETVDVRLRTLCYDVLSMSPFDLTITCGRRSQEDQEKAVEEGRSKVHWPHGKHNALEGELATAVDIHPYPIDFKDTRRYYIMAGLFLAASAYKRIPIRLGSDWDGDGVLTDQTFNDLPHVELKG